jgi:hypothetical protein
MGDDPSLDAFVARHAALTLTGSGPRAMVRVEDADYGPVLFHPDGKVEAEGRLIDPKDFTVAGQRRLTQDD